MLLVVGSPSLRRAAIDALAAARFPAYADDLATYGRALQQRNSLLRAIREEERHARRAALLGRDVPRRRRPDRRRAAGGCSTTWPPRWPRPTREIAPDEAAPAG